MRQPDRRDTNLVFIANSYDWIADRDVVALEKSKYLLRSSKNRLLMKQK
jgi:hypothetical protein